MKFDKKTVIINGRKTFYWQKGFNQKGIIVFLHGFPGNHAGLVDLANGFTKEYQVIIPDMPACGQSEPLNQKHTLKNYAEWLSTFLKVLSTDDAIIIGHSFGSRVAMVFCANYPGKVKKLVLITPVLKLDGLLSRLASLKGRIAKLLPKHLRKPWLSNKLYQNAARMIIFKSASPKRRQQIAIMDAKELKHLNVIATIEIFDEFYKSNMISMVSDIKAETLIIAGDKDEIATLKSIKLLSLQLPMASCKVMENSGHLLPLERPLATANIIESWLHKN